MPEQWNGRCAGVAIFGVLLAGCASQVQKDVSAVQASQHTVTVQCMVTGDAGGTPCIEEARQACQSDHVRMQRIESKSVIPATQGVAQAPMPMTQYGVAYVCGN